MSHIITRGYGDNQLIVTRGYGFVGIVIPTVVTQKGKRRRIRPQVIYVDEKYLLDMNNISILYPMVFEPTLLSPTILEEEIARTRLQGLNIASLREFYLELKDSGICVDTYISILLSKMIALSEDSKDIEVEVLRTLLSKDESLLALNIETLKKEIKKKIKSSNILNKLSLIDKLDKI